MNDVAMTAKFKLREIVFRAAVPDDVAALHDLYLQLILDEDPEPADMR